MNRLSALLLTGVFVAACGGGDSGEQASEPEAAAPAEMEATAPASTGELTTPEWMSVDEAAQTVVLDIVAGSTTDNNNWNYNGLYGGTGEIVVPAGYTVTLNFQNNDPGMAHSVGIDSQSSSPYPGAYTDPQPAFDGAITANATSLTDGTMPGQSATIEFTASEPGEYGMICYVPGHALAGMYVKFIVSAEGESGVRM